MSVAPHHRFPWLRIAVLGVVVVGCFAVAGWLLSGAVRPVGQLTAAPTPTAQVSVDAAGATILLALRDARGAISSAVLIGSDPEGTSFEELHVPGALLLPGAPPRRLAQEVGVLDLADLATRTSAELGLRIDSVLVLDPLGWTGLVDATGQPAWSGPADVADVVAGIPSSETDVAQLLSSLGSMARTNAANADVVRLLAEVSSGARSGTRSVDTVQVDTLRPGAALAASVDRDVLRRQATRLFPYAALTAEDQVAVVTIERAGATLGRTLQAQVALEDAGFVTLRGGSRDPVPTTVVLGPTGRRAEAEGLAKGLGLDAGVAREAPDVPGLTVLLGPDYPVE